MARKNNNSTRGNDNNNFQSADAFLRLELVDGQGNKHRLPKDVALYMKNWIGEQMIAKASSEEDFEFNLIGKVHVVDNSPKDDIEF